MALTNQTPFDVGVDAMVMMLCCPCLTRASAETLVIVSLPTPDGLLLFGQLPLLQIDGLNLVQSRTVVQYIADRAGLLPANRHDRAR